MLCVVLCWAGLGWAGLGWAGLLLCCLNVAAAAAAAAAAVVSQAFPFFSACFCVWLLSSFSLPVDRYSKRMDEVLFRQWMLSILDMWTETTELGEYVDLITMLATALFDEAGALMELGREDEVQVTTLADFTKEKTHNMKVLLLRRHFALAIAPAPAPVTALQRRGGCRCSDGAGGVQWQWQGQW